MALPVLKGKMQCATLARDQSSTACCYSGEGDLGAPLECVRTAQTRGSAPQEAR